MTTSIICTLYENDYAYGVGALLNSLVDIGFRGRIIVLYGDKKPFWVDQLAAMGESLYKLHTDIELEFRPVSSDMHLAYYKPYMLDALRREYPASNLFYFDPDITVVGDWGFFDEWVSYGVALCLDQSYPIKPAGHPIKQSWTRIFSALNLPVVNPNEYYVNSGFIGLRPEQHGIIDRWIQLTEFLGTNGHALAGIMVPSHQVYTRHGRLNAICSDQDVLNAALMYTDVPVSIMGPEAMGFTPAGYTMYHNTGKKTWRKSFLKEFLKSGARYAAVDQSYFQYSYSPINLYSKAQRLKQRADKLSTQVLQRIF